MSNVIALHKSLVEIDSTTGVEKAASNFLRVYLESKGFTVESQPVEEGRENILAYLGSLRETRVLVTSHIDTVPPFIPYERRGDSIWGRGTADAKGCVACQIIAVESLVKTSQLREGDLSLLFVVGEERGGVGMRAANKLGLSWETVIFGEPTELKLGRGHKGVVGITVTTKGKAAHSGYPELGKNAIDILVRALAALQAVTLPSSEHFGDTTVNIGVIEGGAAPNVVPDHARAVGRIRIAAGTREQIFEAVQDCIHRVAPEAVVEFSGGAEPILLDYDIEGFETALLNYYSDVPNLNGNRKKYLYGPGSIHVAHANDEHVEIADLETAIEGYKAIIAHALKQRVTIT